MTKAPPPPGVLVVDKPQGPTSHDVVARVRRAMKTREVGHAGTLDPMATGVLVVAVGEGTKLVPWLTADDKGYEATIRLGAGTDTLDAEGTVVAEVPVSPELRAALAEVAAGRAAEDVPLLARALDAERARTEQVPPAFSAIRIDGERAHVLARRGEAPEMPPRAVVVRSLAVASADAETSELRVVLDVGKGYFVRSLARDLAAALGTVGHLTRLRRVRSGAFTAAEAAPLDLPPEELAARLIPVAAAAARALPVSRLTDDAVLAARQGKRLAACHVDVAHAHPTAWLDASGALVAVGAFEGDVGKVLRGFR